MISPNPWLTAVATPPIPEAKAWLAAYDGSAGPAIDLSQAVPSAPPPQSMLERLAEAAGDPASASYGPIVGDLALRQAYAAHVSALYGARLGPQDVMITAGCNLAFVMAAMTVAKAGDSIVLPSPFYFNHAMALGMLGIAQKTLSCRAETGFVPDAQEAERLIDATTRAIVLVTPNNPTGAIYPAETIEGFAALCARKGLALIVDETYRDFLPDSQMPPHRLLARAEAERAHVLQLYSFSKAYGIPGHRLGAVIAAPLWRADFGKVLDTLQICPPRPGQIACAWAIPALGEHRARNRDEILRRAETFTTALSPLNDWQIASIGAYFAYVKHPFTGVPTTDVAKGLATQKGVLALPGHFFEPGDHGYLRFAFANADEAAIAALPERLKGLGL